MSCIYLIIDDDGEFDDGKLGCYAKLKRIKQFQNSLLQAIGVKLVMVPQVCVRYLPNLSRATLSRPSCTHLPLLHPPVPIHTHLDLPAPIWTHLYLLATPVPTCRTASRGHDPFFSSLAPRLSRQGQTTLPQHSHPNFAANFSRQLWALAT